MVRLPNCLCWRYLTFAVLPSGTGTGQVSECVICQDTFVVGTAAKQMPCQHVFHTECILPWLKEASGLLAALV